MADSKISALTALAEASTDDELVIVDKLSPDVTKKITKGDLLSDYAQLSGATYTGTITAPQGAYTAPSIVIDGSTPVGLFNVGAGLGVGDGTNISFIAYQNSLLVYTNITPGSDDSLSIGHEAARYNNVYSTNGTFDSVTVDGSDVLTTADVDDTPETGATTAPVSSNWAYGHENSASAHAITSISGLGNNVETFLGTPSSANLASAVTDGTGSGALVFGAAPTLSQINDNSTITYNGTDYGIGYRSIPAVTPDGAVTASAAHNGKCIIADDTVTVPSTLAVGTVISVWVNSGNTISIEKSGGTMYLNGTDVPSVTADAYGIATIYFPTSSTMVVTGNVS